MKNLYLRLFLFVALVAIGACEYDFIEPDDPLLPPDTNILFSEQIVPIFTTNNNCTECHKAGGNSPDLTADAAYQNLIDQNLVSVNQPEESVLYQKLKPESADHSWKKFTPQESTLVLEWIRQGALNN